MTVPTSPFAPSSPAKLPAIEGVKLAAAEANIRYSGRTDLMLMTFDEGTTVAGVFTKSTTCGAPVTWCRQNLAQGEIRGLVVNSGNANVFTGTAGERLVEDTAAAAAKEIGANPSQVFVSSTGVIGELPPRDKVLTGLSSAAGELSPNGWQGAAEAIMTTDTFAKLATLSVEIDGVPVTINGIAKGSGMIAPDMATMLVYVVTDANIAADVLQAIVEDCVATTFNAITVDSDTSTSDTLLAAATCKAKHDRISLASDPGYFTLRDAFQDLFHDLALQVVSDGEGISKLAEIEVSGASSTDEAKRVAMAIANAPLVKTALAGSDPNWGRIVMAIGKTGVEIDQNEISVSIGNFQIAANGAVVEDYDEKPVADYMSGERVQIGVNLGMGAAAFTVWTSDLTHGYIEINADYRS